jgi:UDP-N-acetylmuramoyl-L-alanyl-D-glutamate--2,6-diaminopimelate ligase
MAFRSTVKKLIPHQVFKVVEPYGHLAEAMIAQNKHGFPAKKLNVIGVTGTSGKTTTTTLMASVLRAAGYKTAYFTTVENDFGNGPEHNATRMTTLGASQLVRNIQKAQENGCEWLVIEVASHALAQHRVWGVPFKAGIITNLSHEHLDYHGTFEAYRTAKQKLFKLVKKYKGVGIVNADDANVKYFAGIAKTVTYGREKPADVSPKDVQISSHGSTYTVVSEYTEPFMVKTQLPAAFNVSNSLAVVAAGLALGIPADKIAQGIADLPSVPGRMASYKTDADFSVIIDFAHTPDSFEKIFKEVRPLTKGKLTAVFGCAGERDHERRHLQGKLAADYCERIILTEDDPRSEDNVAINAEIREGITHSSKKPEVIENNDRTEAIDKAVELAGKGDVILLLSKGHEKTIALAGGKEKPWDEAKALKQALKKHHIKLL